MRACVGLVAVYVVGIYSHSHLSCYMYDVVLMLFQEINKHSYFVFSSHDGAHFIP